MDTRINQENRKNDPFYDLVNSMPEYTAPVDFTSLVMEEISTLKEVRKAYSLKVPFAIKIGIPVILAVCLILSLIKAGPIKIPDVTFGNGNLNNWLEQWSGKGSSWLQDLIPSFQLPDHLISIIAIGIVLFWGFFFLYRYLSRRFDYRTQSV